MKTNVAESYSDEVSQSQIQNSVKKDSDRNLEHLLKITRQDLLVTRDQNKDLNKEVSALRNKLLVHEKIRRKEKEEYEKNLSDLGLKLLDFESQLSSEQQDIEQLLVEKDNQIKAQKDLIDALRRSVKDKLVCKTCNHHVNQSVSTEQLRPELYKSDFSLHPKPELKHSLSLPLDLSNNTELPASPRKSCRHILSPVPEELEYINWGEQGSPLTPGCHSRLSESPNPSISQEANHCDNLIDHINVIEKTSNDAAILSEGPRITERNLSIGTSQNDNRQLEFDDISLEVKIILDQIIESVENEYDDNSSASETQFWSDGKVEEMLDFNVKGNLKEGHDNETESSHKIDIIVNSQSIEAALNLNVAIEEDTSKNNKEKSFVCNNTDFNHEDDRNKKNDEPDESETDNSTSSSSSEGILAVEFNTSSNDAHDTSNNESIWHDSILDIDNIDFDISDNTYYAKNPLDVIFPLNTSESNNEVLIKNGISTLSCGSKNSSEHTDVNLIDLDQKHSQPENIVDGLLNPMHLLLPEANNETLKSDFENLEDYDVIELDNGL